MDMKKLLFVMALVASAAALFAGGSRQATSIGVAIYRYDDTFMSSVRNVIQQNANTAGGVTLRWADSQNAQPTQNDQVDQFIAQNVSALLINPVDRTAAASIVDKARARNIPVVFFNREPEQADIMRWERVFYVGAKAEDSGTYKGEILAEWWHANPQAHRSPDGSMRVIMLKGQAGHQDAELRTEYSLRALRAAGITVEVLAEEIANWQVAEATDRMSALIARFGDQIDAVLCNNDDMALGAIQALRNAGYFTGGRYIPVVGVDATAPGLQALAEGTLLGTVLNDSQGQGRASFELAYALANGQPASAAGWEMTDGRYIWVPYQKVTRENYTQFLQR
jgi:methyl-galactoside transport system substrate-binding protein